MALQYAQDNARTWLFDAAAPFWAGRGVHADGMFVEAFSRTGEPLDSIRRLRVQARQIYSFCEIGRLGWNGPWREIVACATDHLINKGISTNYEFVHAFDSTGAVADDRQDLYNQAFGLFALAHAADALCRRELFDVAQRVLDRLENHWSRLQGGYWEGDITPCPPFRQNPHMHLFEAGLAHYSFTGDPRWKEFATRLAVMFKGRLQDNASGAVTEYFDESWKPLTAPEGIIVEPGHCLEWAWLFEADFGPIRDTATAEQLLGFARRWGICHQRNLAINEVSLNGEVLDGCARLWPQTERLKSAVARHRRTGMEADEQEIIAAYQGLTRYFDPDCPAIWYDKIDEAGQPVDEPSPASSLYHIVCGLSELLKA